MSKKKKSLKDPIDFKLEPLVFVALGEASMCWENVGGKGRFKSEDAEKIGYKLIEDIKKLVII